MTEAEVRTLVGSMLRDYTFALIPTIENMIDSAVKDAITAIERNNNLRGM